MRRRRFDTVRARTTAVACVVVAAALAVGGLLVIVLMQRSLVSNVDDAARAHARDVSSLASMGDLPRTLSVSIETDRLVQVVNSDRRVVPASVNLDGAKPMAAFEPAGVEPVVRTLEHLPTGDSERFRVVALRVRSPSTSGPLVVYVAASLEQVDHSVALVRMILFVGLPLLLALVAATTWFLVARALRPVDSIRWEVADITAHHLTRRVPVPPSDDEIGRLARTMNEMLDRLQAFTERQRQFVANASHELQSPIASSRAELEVARTHPEVTDWMATSEELLDDNRRMGHLVGDLLFLARAADKAAFGVRRPVDVDDVVREEVNRLEVRARVPIDTSDVSAAEVTGDADQIARAVRNLIENAERYAATTVAITLHAHDGIAELVVTDDGPGIPAEHHERVFERFTRLDAARSRESGGAGLGLSIAREIAEAHGGTINVDEPVLGARLVLTLPTR